jgi:hypothetical protein
MPLVKSPNLRISLAHDVGSAAFQEESRNLDNIDPFGTCLYDFSESGDLIPKAGVTGRSDIPPRNLIEAQMHINPPIPSTTVL